MTPVQASFKKMEKIEFDSLQDKRKRKPQFQLGQLVRTAVIKRVFINGDSTNWSTTLYTITEVLHDTIPSYRLDFLPEIYNENLLR